jgi:hypothetical protein
VNRFLKASFALIFMSATLFADSKDGRLDIYFIDVEGGAATLINIRRKTS